MTNRELATILAALRYWQAGLLEINPQRGEMHFEDHDPLSIEEIDVLCERLNFADTRGVTDTQKSAARRKP